MKNDGFIEREVERLLSGETPEDEELAGLAPFVKILRAEGDHVPSDADTVRHAARAAEIVRSKRAGLSDRVDPGRDPAKRKGREAMRLRPKIAAALVVALLLSGMTGVVYAADRAVPGDTLYGLDRALENVGVNDGGAAERLAEVRELVENGRPEAALDHAGEALAEAESEGAAATELEQARAALQAAGGAISDIEEGGEHAREVRTGVSTLLKYMSENLGEGVGDDGEEFGRGVAGLAGGISSGNSEGATDGVPDEGDGAGHVPPDDANVPEDTPGADVRDDAGAPEDVPGGAP